VSIHEISGPGLDKAMKRKLYSMDLTEEQCEHIWHKGARDPHARVKDMDLMGIDQVMVIPLRMVSHFLFVKNHRAAALAARAYNDWVFEWCSSSPERLFPAACIPSQNPEMAAAEIMRVAKRGFKAMLVRPVDAQSNYPIRPATEPMWRAVEETGIVVGMHQLMGAQAPIRGPYLGFSQLDDGHNWTPGTLVGRAENQEQTASQGQSLSFIHEAKTWLVSVLLSGFLEKYPKISRMAIMESNASWLPHVLEECDKAFKLYKNERVAKVTRLPSELFFERFSIAFEGDESPVFKQHAYFQDVGIWSSDAYHHDGADAWAAIREMEKVNVPQKTQAKLMGTNAAHMYGITPKLFVTEEPAEYPRPDWFPKQVDVDKEFAPLTRV
jgi:predicted TIM-barrel fold metal-dependent hydrolase